MSLDRVSRPSRAVLTKGSLCGVLTLLMLVAVPACDLEAGSISDLFGIGPDDRETNLRVGNAVQPVLHGTFQKTFFPPFPNPNRFGIAGFHYTLTFPRLDPIDLVFHVSNSGSLSRLIVQETVINQSALIPWSGFKHELGFGFATRFFDDFAKSSASDGLAFRQIPVPFDNGFNFGQQRELQLTMRESDALVWGGGNISGFSGAFFPLYDLNIPDVSDAIPEAARDREGYFFTLRQTPVELGPVPQPTPEPTTLLLVGTTAAGLGLARWRQRRRKQQP